MQVTRPFFRQTHVLTRHSGIVNELKFSSDGTILASLGTTLRFINTLPCLSHEVCLWDMKYQKVISSFPIYKLETLCDIDTSDVFFSSVLFISRSRLLVGTTNGLLVQLDFDSNWDIKFKMVSLKSAGTEREVTHLTRSHNPTTFACALASAAIVFSVPQDSSIESMQTLRMIVPRELTNGCITTLHWMLHSTPLAILIAYHNGCINVWDVQTGFQLRYLRLPVTIAEAQVIDDDNSIAVYNAETFTSEIYCLGNGDHIRNIFSEQIHGPGLSLPLLNIPEQSWLVTGGHYGKAYIHHIGKERTHEYLKMKDSCPVLCLAYYHDARVGKTLLACGSIPGPHSTDHAHIVLWETYPSLARLSPWRPMHKSALWYIIIVSFVALGVNWVLDFGRQQSGRSDNQDTSTVHTDFQYPLEFQ